MPIIDVYAPADLFPEGSDRDLAEQLMQAAMRAERIPHPVPAAIQAMTAAYIHRLPAKSVHTAISDQARTVRVQLLAAAGGVGKEGQKEFVAAATQIVADVVGDPDIKASTWVTIVEAMAGWGVAGEVLFKEDGARFFK
jgi:phenylpyruvate tautomerase PptA (4-oxalocrotonate tautomerase family)